VLVVALSDSTDEHLLRYETPLRVEGHASALREFGRRFVASRKGYHVEYEARFPATLRSYHLVTETAQGVDITTMYLSTDADLQLTARLTADLNTIADKWSAYQKQPIGLPTKKIIELQAQAKTRLLADLLRRRDWEANYAGLRLQEELLSASYQLSSVATAGEAVKLPNQDLNNSILDHPRFHEEGLRKASQEIVESQLGRDLSLERDPPANRAHAYWRRPANRLVEEGQIRVTSHMILRDGTAAGPRAIVAYAVAVAGITYVTGCFLTQSLFPYGEELAAVFEGPVHAEALVAVLLLVPGFLYTRLSLPPKHSIVGYLKGITRFIAHVSIFAMALLSAAIAAHAGGWLIRLMFVACTLLPLLSTLLLVGKLSEPPAVALARTSAPRWAVGKRRRWRRPGRPNVRYYSSGAAHDTSR
jgi:hypothetical protein